MISLRLTNDTVTPALDQLRAQAKNPRGIMAAASRAVANLFKSHLRQLDRTRPNKLGGKRTHMWNEFARSVNVSSLTDTSATVSISDPRAAQKHKGGVITAKRAKFLTIPVAPEAHGRTARTLASELGIKLFVLGTGDRAVLAGQAASFGGGVQKPGRKRTEGKAQPQGFKVYYLLKRSVTQPPDPPEGILPTDGEIKVEALFHAQAALTRQLKPGGKT